MALMTHTESTEEIKRITLAFVTKFLDDNASRCLDDADDRAQVGIYLSSNLLLVSTELARAAMGLKK